jgi:hypothetical protein
VDVADCRRSDGAGAAEVARAPFGYGHRTVAIRQVYLDVNSTRARKLKPHPGAYAAAVSAATAQPGQIAAGDLAEAVRLMLGREPDPSAAGPR